MLYQTEDILEILQKATHDLPGIKLIDVESLPTIRSGGVEKRSEAKDVGDTDAVVCVLYTSGSTGTLMLPIAELV